MTLLYDTALKKNWGFHSIRFFVVSDRFQDEG